MLFQKLRAEVNAASKLGEDTAKAWEILVTDSVAAELTEMPGVQLEQIDTIPPGAKAAYNGLKKQSSLYVPIDGVPNSLYSDKLHVVNILERNVFLGVQGNFIITSPLPIHFYDAKIQLRELAQTGAQRI